MIEVKDNEIIIDGVVKYLNNVNLIKSENDSVYFSSNIVERIKKYPYNIKEVYKQINNAGLTNFWLTNNTIINLNNIESVHIKYYQYAGLSIIETSKLNAEKCFVNMVCKNRKIESIGFSSDKEAEKFYHELDDKLIEIKTAQLLRGK